MRDWDEFFLLTVSSQTEAAKFIPVTLILFYIDLTILPVFYFIEEGVWKTITTS